VRLVIDEADRPGETMLPQRTRELETRMAGADDQDRS
jgi:hypothetical protein